MYTVYACENYILTKGEQSTNCKTAWRFDISKTFFSSHIADLALQIFSWTASLSHGLLVAVWKKTMLTVSSLTLDLLVRFAFPRFFFPIWFENETIRQKESRNIQGILGNVTEYEKCKKYFRVKHHCVISFCKYCFLFFFDMTSIELSKPQPSA